LVIRPATPERWPDVAALFGANGACGGCWCQFWKQSQAGYLAGKGAANRRALRRQVAAGVVPGLLAYAGGEPVGWVAVEPRAAYARLARARNLVAVDDAPVWSAPCFFVKRGWRGRGVAGRLLEAAAARARAAGAPFLEGYPIDSQADLGDAFVYTGAYSTFVRLGFLEVARKARTRPVMRLRTGPRVVAWSRVADGAPRRGTTARGASRSRPARARARKAPGNR
jgi:GNAT superfamily N-acetyltransferase